MSEEVGKIFVGGVDRDSSSDVFRAYFEKFGKISDIILMMDKDKPGTNKGFGFVTYADPVVVESVVSNKHHQLDGKSLDCKHCKARGSERRNGPGGGDQRTKKVFVGGISQQATKEDLYEAFSTYGTVEDVHIMTDTETGKHRGFGFVTLDSEEAVDKLVRLQHLELKGKSMEIKKAQPKTNRGFGGQGQMGGGGGGYGGGGGGGNWNQGGQGGYGGGGQYGGQQGGYQQQRGGGQQQGYGNGYRQQQQGGYGQQQQPQPSYGGKPSGGGDNGDERSRNGAQSYGGGYGGYGQAQQDPYAQQQQQPQQQYGSQGSMGSYAQEASGYGPQRGGTYSTQQGYNQGQQQPQQAPQQPSYGQAPAESAQDPYGSNNYGKANQAGNQFHPYSR